MVALIFIYHCLEFKTSLAETTNVRAPTKTASQLSYHSFIHSATCTTYVGVYNTLPVGDVVVAVPLRSVEGVLAVAVVVESAESAELWPLL